MYNLCEEGQRFYNSGDREKAKALYMQGDGEGDVYCSFHLARLLNEEGTKKAKKRAKEIFGRVFPLLEDLAERGEVQAQHILSITYVMEEFVEQDLVKSAFYAQKAAENGNTEAQVLLAMDIKWEIPGVEGSQEDSMYWYMEAAQKGSVSAMRSLGLGYAEGKGVERSGEEAIYWLTQAAERGDKFAMYDLLRLYEEGAIVKKTYQRMQYWAEKIAQCGDSHDKLNIAMGYYWGDLNKKPNPKRAMCWCRRAVKEGNTDAMRWLAHRYEHDERDYEKALHWYKKAASEKADAMYCVAQYYHKGKGVKRAYATAIHWYELAAKAGDNYAKYELAKAYFHGKIAERNYDRAFEYFQALEKDFQYIEAQVNDGAPDIFLKQDKKMFKEVLYYLGNCYHHGYGVKSDWQTAKKYYERAMSLGYKCEYAMEMLKIDLGEFRKVTEMENYAQSLANLKLSAEELRDRITQDLKSDFGDNWDCLKENAKIGLITGVLTYITFVSMGKDFFNRLDFSAVIVNFAKALEVELAEYFYKGYVMYLKKKGVSPAVFSEDACFLSVKKERGIEVARGYQSEHDVKNFRLGGLKFIIDDKFELTPTLEGAKLWNPTAGGRSEAYRKHKNFKGEIGVRTIDKHMVDYANELFSAGAFDRANRKKEIVNYLVDLSNAVGEIAYQYRNPAAHGDVMQMQKASACGDYLIKVRKLIYGFMSKIKKKYRGGVDALTLPKSVKGKTQK